MAGVLSAAVAVFYVACEDTPSDESVDGYFSNNPYQSQPRATPATAAVTIFPSSSSAQPGQQILFQAVNGESPFSWGEATAGHGTVAPQSNNRYALYTHLGTTNDANNVTVTDSAGATAIANINL